VMKRVAAPMVGGLFTSAFLTLEIIPVLYTWWRWRDWQRTSGTTRPATETDRGAVAGLSTPEAGA